MYYYLLLYYYIIYLLYYYNHLKPIILRLQHHCILYHSHSQVFDSIFANVSFQYRLLVLADNLQGSICSNLHICIPKLSLPTNLRNFLSYNLQEHRILGILLFLDYQDLLPLHFQYALQDKNIQGWDHRFLIIIYIIIFCMYLNIFLLDLFLILFEST